MKAYAFGGTRQPVLLPQGWAVRWAVGWAGCQFSDLGLLVNPTGDSGGRASHCL